MIQFKKYGSGKINIILFHGWGFNSNIWMFNLNELKKKFTVYTLDLPGYGQNHNILTIKINTTIILLKHLIPNNSILVGWSLGGLIATKLALICQEKILALITISSSPKFLSSLNWPGVDMFFLKKIFKNIQINFYTTIKEFLELQLYKTISKKKIELLQHAILSEPKPSLKTLKIGFKILKQTNLIKKIKNLKFPILRIYGKFDLFIPYSIKNILDDYYKNNNNYSIIMEQSAHIPFISEKKKFHAELLKFLKKNNI